MSHPSPRVFRTLTLGAGAALALALFASHTRADAVSSEVKRLHGQVG